MGAGLKQFAYGVVVIIAAILAGFFGGMIVPWWLGWIPEWCTDIESPSSPISIANTYIVFTTIIFVVAIAILVVIGFFSIRQFSVDIFNGILREIKSDKEKGNLLAQAIFENPSVNKQIIDNLERKIGDILQMGSKQRYHDGKISDELFDEMEDENRTIKGAS
uniref:Uncharacterized protein n=1 Tax=Candidatus Kentrum sp. LPFa TaxID=2126335 RepID=A0A450XXV7_9GAMM|nr:MAG: hypothetical protein BECKLPF1236A_GA0070988_102462 [Candidatus Kentron sp. LPFa]VFK34085.1 MAG: hypothetical protein BECKLPF1236C_GA0070990_102432 [Candidatus Kentron sp. LPFa]